MSMTKHSPELVQAAPGTLLVDVNVRQDARLDKELVASVRDLGVLQPITAVRTAEGALRVRFGHRRTLAALDAGLDTVPVLVVADEATDDTGQIERLVTQYAENEHRTGLTTAERLSVAAQLTAFGVTPAQIAKKTKMARMDVDAALIAARSKLAQGAAERYDFLDLMQAAVIAEFDDQPEVVKALVAAARTGQFDHVAQRARDDRAEAAAKQEAVDQLAATGVPVVERPSYDSPARELAALTTGASPDRAAMTPEDHSDCPGHAAFVARQWTEGDLAWLPTYVCLDAAQHGHELRYGAPQRSAVPSEEAKELASQERREVIANNKAWRSAEVVRLDWLRTFAARPGAPKGTADFLAATLGTAGRVLESLGTLRGLNGLESVLGVPPHAGHTESMAALTADVPEKRGTLLALAVALIGYEASTELHHWRSVNPNTCRYFTFLESCGYVLSPVEALACGRTSAE